MCKENFMNVAKNQWLKWWVRWVNHHLIPCSSQSIMISYSSPTLTNLPKPEQHGSNGCLILHDTSENENMCRFMSSGDGCFRAAGAVQAHAIAAASWRQKKQDAVHSAKHHDSLYTWAGENAPQNMQRASNWRTSGPLFLNVYEGIICIAICCLNVKCRLKVFWKVRKEKSSKHFVKMMNKRKKFFLGCARRSQRNRLL